MPKRLAGKGSATEASGGSVIVGKVDRGKSLGSVVDWWGGRSRMAVETVVPMGA